MYMNPTTWPAETLKAFNFKASSPLIPVAESYQADNYDTWAKCPRCGRYHLHTAEEYTQGLLAAKCEADDPLINPKIPPFYFIHIEGLATSADVARFLKFTAKRKRESDAGRKSLAKQEAFRLKIEASRRK
ncbi:MAG: hypothetical protein ACK4FJ_03575 [Ferrovibrio sp.]|uniref:hypothetical protein n=1 Tax=Ferrovibrio sp. TaxID=1917215 RepID=UPI00391A6F25